MDMIKEVIMNYGVEMIMGIFTVIASTIGLKVKSLYMEHIDNEQKEKAVKTVVGAVEQLYKDLEGKERFDIAKENVMEILNSKGVKVTELEIDMLIESFVNSLKK